MILAQQSSGGGFSLLLLLALPVVLYLMMRSQKRKASQQQTVQQGAEVGDEIMTTAGMFGTIVDEDEDAGTVEVEIAPGTRVTMIRGAIARIITDDDEDEVDDGDTDTDEEDDDVIEVGGSDAGETSAEADNAEGPFRS
jgi:preprotein translocase subunit YajC